LILNWAVRQQKDWIAEDVGRPCFSEGFKQADIIILLEIPLKIRKRRILLQWKKQRIGIEKSLYIPSYAMLKCMFIWARDYDSGKDGLHDRIKLYQNKLIVLHNHKEINKFISGVRV